MHNIGISSVVIPSLLLLKGCIKIMTLSHVTQSKKNITTPAAMFTHRINALSKKNHLLDSIPRLTNLVYLHVTQTTEA